MESEVKTFKNTGSYRLESMGKRHFKKGVELQYIEYMIKRACSADGPGAGKGLSVAISCGPFCWLGYVLLLLIHYDINQINLSTFQIDSFV